MKKNFKVSSITKTKMSSFDQRAEEIFNFLSLGTFVTPCIINEQTKNNKSTQEIQRLIKQLRYLKYAQRELNLILHLTNH
jgi:hypothetical protein